jgi:hypothetical protein
MKVLKYIWLCLIIFVFGFLSLFAFAKWDTKTECRGIKLNTKVPFLWNCINVNDGTDGSSPTPLNAFPMLMWSMMNLLMTVIMVMSLLLIVYAWVLMTMEWAPLKITQKWMDIITKVATWLALLWASWVILKVINPNFFT